MFIVCLGWTSPTPTNQEHDHGHIDDIMITTSWISLSDKVTLYMSQFCFNQSADSIPHTALSQPISGHDFSHSTVSTNQLTAFLTYTGLSPPLLKQYISTNQLTALPKQFCLNQLADSIAQTVISTNQLTALLTQFCTNK